MSLKKGLGVTAGVMLWLAGITASLCALQRYSSSAGPARDPGNQVEKFFAANRQPGRPLLVMAIHPRCPCTRASLGELGDLLARSHGACDALLLQYIPSPGATGWPVDPSPRLLEGVSVAVLMDPGGKLAASLGAETSGHAVLMDAEGAIRFHGGLTIARGHRGRSPAQDAILEILSGGRPVLASAPVYGCTLGAECSAPVTP